MPTIFTIKGLNKFADPALLYVWEQAGVESPFLPTYRQLLDIYVQEPRLIDTLPEFSGCNLRPLYFNLFKKALNSNQTDTIRAMSKRDGFWFFNVFELIWQSQTAVIPNSDYRQVTNYNGNEHPLWGYLHRSEHSNLTAPALTVLHFQNLVQQLTLNPQYIQLKPGLERFTLPYTRYNNF